MVGQPFTQRIINPLERPSSQDQNLAQSQLNANVRALARSLLERSVTAAPSGSLGASFLVEATTPSASDAVTVKRGVGFGASIPTESSIGGILGLDNMFDYPVIYSQDRSIVSPIAGAPLSGPGVCRRDVIALRAIGGDAQGLSNLTPTDIYIPVLNKFEAAAVYKSLTSDLTDKDVQFKQPADPFEGAIVYSIGAEAPWTGNPDELLAAPITAAPGNAGYINVAIINRYPGQTVVAADDIVDYRILQGQYGEITIHGSATIGSVSGSGANTGPGAYLSDFVYSAPPGIKAGIYKSGNDTLIEADKTNTYILAIGGVRNVQSATVSVALSTQASATETFGAMVRYGQPVLNQAVDLATEVIFLDPTKSAGALTVLAIGQVIHFLPFTLGMCTSTGAGASQFDPTWEVFAADGFTQIRTQPVSFTVTLKVG